MSASKTEQLVLKCFCECCCVSNKNEPRMNCPAVCAAYDFQWIARAARRFVKADNIRKSEERYAKFLRVFKMVQEASELKKNSRSFNRGKWKGSEG